MPAQVRLRDGSGVTDQNNVDLGTTTAGTPGASKKFSLVNIGDAAAVDVGVAVVCDPYVENLTGNAVASAVSDGNAVVTGTYNLTFSQDVAQWRVHVNGGAAINITPDGTTQSTNVIAGVAIIFNNTVSATDTSRITINDGHTYVQIAPDVAGVPGTFVSGPISNLALYPGTNPFTLSVTNVADATQTGIDYQDSIPLMTAQTTNGVTVTGFTTSGNTTIWNMMDDDDSDAQSFYVLLNGGFTIDFGSNSANWPTVEYYAFGINPIGSNNRKPLSWKLEVSNDNSSWTAASTITNNNTWDHVHKKQVFSLSAPHNATAYRYYRWTLTASQGNAEVYMGDFELLKKTNRISPATYNYAIVGVLSDGRTTQPTRASVVVASSSGTKNVLNWTTAVPGLTEIRVYQGTVSSERLLASLAPTATSYEDRFGVPGTTFESEDLLALETFEETTTMNSGLTGAIIAQQIRPMGAMFVCPAPATTNGHGNAGIGILDTGGTTTTTAPYLFNDSIRGKGYRTNSWHIDLPNKILWNAEGAFQMVFSIPVPTSASACAFITIGNHLRTGAGDRLFIYQENGVMKYEIWRNNVEIGTSTYGGSAQSAQPALTMDQRYVLTINWGAGGTNVYLNDTLVYRWSLLTSFSTNFDKTFDTTLSKMTLARCTNSSGSVLSGDYIIEEFGFYGVQRTTQQITNKVLAITTYANLATPPASPDAHTYKFWVRQNPPLSILTGLQPKAFSLRVTGNTM